VSQGISFYDRRDTKELRLGLASLAKEEEMSDATIVELDELRLLIVVDNEIDLLSSIADGMPQVAAAAYLAERVPVERVHAGHPCKIILDRHCCAGHGFSVLLTGRRGDETRTMLFDAGPYGWLWKENAARLGIDLAAIETVFLSHWHSDHSGALLAALAAIAEARRFAGRPAPVVDLHPDRPDQRGVITQSGMIQLLPPEPGWEALAAAGGSVARRGEAHALCDGFFFGSGAIPRVTDYETGLVGHHTLRGDGLVPDPLIQDERFVGAHVRGRGVTILSACSHAGIVNACLAAQATFGREPIDVVLGGYHLSGVAMEKRIDATASDLHEKIRPRVLAPGHCTGWRAKAALAHRFAPTAYAPSAVGSMYVLKAAG
jgi:7,8-dihydropterin-6-yl-methyl-4-(beta-D-ribofuranosyl)aminobenzene 5'-phosphate synthase